MMKQEEFFADGIGQIHFAGSMVRYDFVNLQPGAEGSAPVPQGSVRIIMPPQGFLRMFNSMRQLIDRLVEAGVLQKTEPAKSEPVKSAKGAKSAPAKGKAAKKAK